MTVTGDKKCRDLEQTKALLSASRRDSLFDHAFGDEEVAWFSGDKMIATAYYGSSGKSVTIDQDGEFATTHFNGHEAEELRDLGNTSSRSHQNDAGDPRFW